jgi:hypothetical protein
MDTVDENQIYDKYFPDFEEINLDIDNIIDNVFRELNENKPTQMNSSAIKDIYEISRQINEKDIEKFENNLKKMNEADLVETIDKSELLNFKLIMEYKNLFNNFSK